MIDTLFITIQHETVQFITQPNLGRSVIGILIAIVVAYWVSRIVTRAIVKVAQFIAVRSDNAANEEKAIQLRRVETYLSIAIAVVRVVIVVTIVFLAWRLLANQQNTFNTAVFALGAGAFIAVVSGATIGMVLRDITAGAVMIIENWFHVGDFIRIEPFGDVSGVVEQVTLRSTKLRNINGEIIWLHNQHIQAVKVTPHGLRRLAVDVFVNSKADGETLINKAIETMPIGTMKVAKKPQIVREEQWGDQLYYFTVIGETPPGREWLMENYFLESLKELDERRKTKAMVRPPIVRYSDPAAERSFKRAVRSQKNY